ANRSVIFVIAPIVLLVLYILAKLGTRKRETTAAPGSEETMSREKFEAPEQPQMPDPTAREIETERDNSDGDHARRKKTATQTQTGARDDAPGKPLSPQEPASSDPKPESFGGAEPSREKGESAKPIVAEPRKSVEAPVEIQMDQMKTGSAPEEELMDDALAQETIAEEAGTEEEGHYYIAEVFYATDREKSSDEKDVFGTDRAASGALNHGLAHVSIPKAHEAGVVEQPKWYHHVVGVADDPERFFKIQDIKDFDEQTFYRRVDAFQAARGSREAFVFIHGYCNTFQDALFRSAQMTFDMSFSGACLCYSWPSTGKISSYLRDGENAKWSVPHLEDFLMKLSSVPHIDQLHLVAHSMGNQVLVRAMENLQLKGQETRFNQILLTAPDIDAGVFHQVHDKITSMADRVTLYASRNDRALKASGDFTDFPRLGDISEGIFISDGIDTIDASDVDTDLYGHNYFAGSDSVLDDIRRLMDDGAPPPERENIRQLQDDNGRIYWLLDK
ncbi:MAG: alpha/beta hydrolase, partial [Methyloligellaceae bacterium]